MSETKLRTQTETVFVTLVVVTLMVLVVAVTAECRKGEAPRGPETTVEVGPVPEV